MSHNNCISKVAVVQDSPVFLDKEATIEKVCTLIKAASQQGANLILFPEAFISGYPDWVWTLPAFKKQDISKMFTALYNSSISTTDKAIKLLCESAKLNNIIVVIGANEKNSERSNATLFNSMIYIDNTGKLLGIHRKLIPTKSERMMWGQGDGNSLLSFDTSIGKIGGLLCWENYMPLARNVMYEAGVQIYLAPTWDSSETWLNAMRHIAFEGGMFVLSTAQAIKKDEIPDEYEFKKLYADDREWINKGNSCIINPQGQIISDPLKERQGIIYADMDLNEITNQKWQFDVAGHYARPDVFDFSVNKKGD